MLSDLALEPDDRDIISAMITDVENIEERAAQMATDYVAINAFGIVPVRFYVPLHLRELGIEYKNES